MRRVSGSGDFRRDVLAGAKAGINQPPVPEAPQRRYVIFKMIRLAAHRGFPGQAEPAQVLDNAVLELGPATALVDVLDPQQKPPAVGGRLAPGDPGRIGMAQVQAACRAWREAGDGGVGGHGKVYQPFLRNWAPYGTIR